MEYNLIGEVLGGRYEILEVIGSGGMATVYKAQCKLLNRFVAIKVLKESLKYDEDVVKRFSTESKAAASLSHHNIVSIYDVGETDKGINYIVMEYVDGVTLKEYITNEGQLEWHEACEFAYQIAMALECAHENGIIHRDIKPHNILLTKDHTLKVTDFGIARTTGSDTVVATGNSGVFGSVHYISPEQARGGYVDAASDIYSLGVVLYEMLAGKVPFDGENPVSVAVMKLENEAEDVREYASHIPDAVAEVVMKAIAKEQYKRYQRAAEMAFDLREVIDQNISAAEVYAARKKKIQPQKAQRKGVSNKKIALSAVILAIILAVAIPFAQSLKKEYQVPDLMDKTLEEAISISREAGFRIDEDNITYVASDDFEEGRIMKQDPGANTSVRWNKKISLVISSGLGEGDIEIPDVEGMTYTEAATTLRAAKLRYRKIEEDNAEVEQNKVISQSPKSGTFVSENYEVLLHVSTGLAGESPEPSDEAELVPIPKLVGKTLEDAETTIRAAGLKRGNISREESDEPVGTVISQSPKEGSESPKDSQVNLVVSSGRTTKTPTPTESTTNKTVLKIMLPQTDSGTVSVKLVANGKKIYEKTHNCSEGEVAVTVSAKNNATVEVYFDGVLATTKVVEF